jgi:hypothetical protein
MRYSTDTLGTDIKTVSITFGEVLIVPGLNHHLLSVVRSNKAGAEVVVDSGGCYIKIGNECLPLQCKGSVPVLQLRVVEHGSLHDSASAKAVRRHHAQTVCGDYSHRLQNVIQFGEQGIDKIEFISALTERSVNKYAIAESMKEDSTNSNAVSSSDEDTASDSGDEHDGFDDLMHTLPPYVGRVSGQGRKGRDAKKRALQLG